MGFFDFLTRQGGPATGANPELAPLSPEATGSTRIVQALLELPRADRNRAWSQRFLAHVADAAFFTRDPEVVLGAERLPFFALHSTPAGQACPAHVIHHLKDDFLLDRGLGVVINPCGQEADWAFTYGDILQFQLHGVFYPDQAGPERPVLTPQARLPQAARKVVRTFLQGLGVAAPEVRFASWDHAGPGSLELVFGFSPQEFSSLDDFRFAMNNLAWFLPRNYSYSVAGNQARQDGGFEPL